MRLKATHITNYKCIEDSGEFSVEPVTCLVGKNESGKTAILEALGPEALKSTEVKVRRGYDNTNQWTIAVDELTTVKHLISASSLHTEESAEASKFTTIKELRAHLEALGESASDRHKQLLTVL